MKKSRLLACQSLLLLATSLLLCPLFTHADCHISTSSPTLDYGQLNRQITRGSDGKMALPPRDVQVKVDCDDEQVMNLNFNSTNGNQQQFTFGRDGYLNVRISALMMNNHPTSFLELSANGEQQSGNQQKMGTLLPGSKIVTVDKGLHLSFILTLLPTFTNKLFSIQDDYQVGSDITIEVSE